MRSVLAAAVAALGIGTAAVPAAAFTVRNPYATGLSNGQISIGTLTIAGDSYSAAGRRAFHNWAEQLTLDDKEVARLADFAKSGATAGTYPPSTNDFAHQVTRWLATSPVLGPKDLSVVYLGYNDIDGGTDRAGADLANAKGDYTGALKRLVAAGATGGGRRVLLVMPHNWGRSPFYVRNGGAQTMRLRTKVWDSFVAKTAQGFSANLVAVDLFTALERVFQNPGAFCFTNVTTADHARSATTAFYDDDFHPGRHGQDLIEQVVQYYLTRGWDWSNTVKDPAAALSRLTQDLDAGKVFAAPCAPAAAVAQQAPSALSAGTAPGTGVDTRDGFGRAWTRHLLETGTTPR